MEPKILVIDDDKEFAEELSSALSLLGYDVIYTSDSSEALEKVEQVHPDVILLDLHMPGKDGFQVTEELHFFSQFFNIPIIAMSGHFSSLFISLLERSGVKKYFHKPFNPEEVIACVNALTHVNHA